MNIWISISIKFILILGALTKNKFQVLNDKILSVSWDPKLMKDSFIPTTAVFHIIDAYSSDSFQVYVILFFPSINYFKIRF